MVMLSYSYPLVISHNYGKSPYFSWKITIFSHVFRSENGHFKSRVHLWQRHLLLLQFHGRQVLSADFWIGWMGSKLTMSGDGWVYKIYSIHKNCVLGIFIIIGFTTWASFRAPEPAYFLRKHSTTRVENCCTSVEPLKIPLSHLIILVGW